MKQLRFLFSRHAAICGAFLLLQQIIVASSTLWLIWLAQDVVEGRPFWLNLGLFLSSLVVPYLPAAMMTLAMARWEQEAIRRYLLTFRATHFSQVGLWTDADAKDRTLTTLNNEGLQTISQGVAYYFRLASAGLNVTLNVIVISVLLDIAFMPAYALSALLGLILIKVQARKQGDLAHRAQRSRIRLGETILSSWDNVLLGNTYNLSRWDRTSESRIRSSITRNVSAVLFQELMSIAIALVTFLPCLAIAAWSMYGHRADAAALTALIVTLPRLFLILSYTYDFLYTVTQWRALSTRLGNIARTVYVPEQSTRLAERISSSELGLSPQSEMLSLQSLLEMPQELTNSKGRYTLRGPNGSGKSSLLLNLKEALCEKAFYLPVDHQLAFDHSAQSSTGQKIREQLREITQKVTAPVVLLDEWDANLDSANLAELSGLIDELALSRLVIEVRHRE